MRHLVVMCVILSELCGNTLASAADLLPRATPNPTPDTTHETIIEPRIDPNPQPRQRQQRIGMNERSHLMSVYDGIPAPFLIAADVVDMTVGYGPDVVYIKNTGVVSTTIYALESKLQDLSAIKVAMSYDAAGYRNVLFIPQPAYMPWSGVTNCIDTLGYTCAALGNMAFGDPFVPIDIAAGAAHVLLLNANGNVKTLGTGPGDNVLTPLIQNVRGISAGIRHNLFLINNGTVRAVGGNDYCQISQTVAGVSYPSSITNASKVVAGALHSLALLSNGTVVGWGCDSQASNTIRVDEAIPPSDIAGRVVDISAGDGISAALLNDGTVRVWGSVCQRNADHCAAANGLANVVKIVPTDDNAAQAPFAYAIIMDPIIDSVSSTTFPTNGGVLTINGDYLKNSKVYIDNNPVFPTINTTNQLVVNVPRHMAGKARVQVFGASHYPVSFDITYSRTMATLVPSATASLTRTATNTRTLTNTRTSTSTPSSTSAKTQPSITTKSLRPSDTRTATRTATRTTTRTNTRTATRTNTRTNTRTATRTHTRTTTRTTTMTPTTVKKSAHP
jgi:hypothetical protein